MDHAALTSKEQRIVLCALAFANLKTIPSAEEVEHPFQKVIRSLPAKFEQRTRTYYVSELQPMVIGWLERIIGEDMAREDRDAERDQVCSEIGRKVLRVESRLFFSEQELRFDYRVASVEAG